MEFFVYPDKITRLLQAFNKQSQSAVRVNEDLTDWFDTRGATGLCAITSTVQDPS